MKEYAKLIRTNKDFYRLEFALNIVNQFERDTVRIGFSIIMMKEVYKKSYSSRGGKWAFSSCRTAPQFTIYIKGE